MKAQLRHVLDHGVEYDVLAFVCPGCMGDGGSGLHLLPVNTAQHSPSWTWDGNLDAPTLEPSILTHWGGMICHAYLRGGVFQYLGDCTHKFAGQHVPMPQLPLWFIEETEDDG